ncbi:MAG: TonB-dependent receptor family protein, partial [Chitinophagales bacterium]
TEEMIKMLPGVNVAGDMGISNRPNIGIRGSDPRRSNKILLLEDGSPISPAPYLAPGAYYNPPADRLDGIQVIKGPDVLIYGANNIFGVVNYITKRPPVLPTTSLKISGGQRGYFTAIGSYGGTWDNTGAEIQALYKRFDGYTDNSDLSMFNIAGKWFSNLTDNQTIYLKVNFQTEYVNNSLSGITPFTFETDPAQHPFDADEFTSHRYGIDFIHHVNVTEDLQLQTKVYGSDFYRDWWKQNAVVIAASDVQSYVGSEIYNDKYAYLNNLEFGPDDYVRVGKVAGGYESNNNSRWQYYVYGIHEKATYKWNTHELEGAIKLHGEKYHDVVIKNDSSRWARSGYTTVDVMYDNLASSAYVRNDFRFGKFSIIPIMRYELIALTKNDLLKNGNNPDNNGTDFGNVTNTFGEFTPGLSFVYRDVKWINSDWEFYGGLYRGFSSPTTAISFNEVLNGEIVPAEEEADLKPEISFNQELGLRFENSASGLNGQAAVFNMYIDNFYSPARNQAFQTLGSVQISGIETALASNFANLFSTSRHSLQAGITFSYMQSRITGGELSDNDLVKSIVHSAATKQELIDKINNNRNAFDVYLDGNLYE